MKLNSILKKIILGVFALLLVYVGVVMTANWNDDTLSPAAQQLLEPSRNTAADASNGYFTLLGINAPKETDAHAAGLRIQAGYERQFREQPMRITFANDEPEIKQTADDIKAWDALHCSLTQADCVTHYLRNAPIVRERIKAEGALLARYAEIMRLPAYEQKLIPSYSISIRPFPHETFDRAARLYLAMAVLDIEAGHADEGISGIVANISLHRRQLASSRSIFSMSASIGMLREDYEILSEVLEHWPALARTQADSLAKILRPLDENETDFRQFLQDTARTSAFVLAHSGERASQDSPGDLATKDGRWSRLRAALTGRCCFLPNATLNLAATYWSDLAQAGHGSAATLDARKQRFMAIYTPKLTAPFRAPWTAIRNPGGIVLMAVIDGNGRLFADMERLHDLDGYIRLVTLQSALRRDQVAGNAASAYAAKAPPGMRNPYNGEAMRWDAASSSLLFEGRPGASADPPSAKKGYRIKMAMP